MVMIGMRLGRIVGLASLLVLLAGCMEEDVVDDGGGDSNSETPDDLEDGLTLPGIDAALPSYVDEARDHMLGKESNEYQPPDPAYRDAWGRAEADLAAGRFEDLEQELNDHLSFYQLDWIETDGDRFAVIEPANPDDHRGWGRVLANPDGTRPLVLEAPHAAFGLHTAVEAARLFEGLSARFLLLAGAHRCANNLDSGCDGTTGVCLAGGGDEPFRESDDAHATDSQFQIAHETLASNPDRIAISLHGNGRSACGDLFISAGVAEAQPAIVSDLAAAIPDGAGLEVAVEGPDAECPLPGTTNVQGRFSNGSDSPCTEPAQSASGRFLHLEQSLDLRENHVEALAEALGRTIPAE